MTRKSFLSALMILLALLLSTSGITAQSPADPTQPQAPLGTAFTYQGYLTDGDEPATGAYDFQFILYDAASGGSQVGSTVIVDDVDVSEGLFTVQLDFGSTAFTGEARYLQIGVRPGAETGVYDLFSARQVLNPTPYALSSASTPWGGLTNVPTDILDGDDDTTYTAGTGLALSGAQFSVSQSVVQFRVTDNCPSGSAIRAINADGTVICESSGGFAWGTSASGTGTGLTLTSSDGIGLSAQGANYGVYGHSTSTTGYGGYFTNSGSDGVGLYAKSQSDGSTSGDPDVVLGGSTGIISTDPDVTGSDLYIMSTNGAQSDINLMAERNIEFAANRDIELNANGDYSDIKLNSVDDIELIAGVGGGNGSIDFESNGTGDIDFFSRDDFDVIAFGGVDIESRYRIYLESFSDIQMVIDDDVNSTSDYFRINKHSTSSGDRVFEVDENGNVRYSGSIGPLVTTRSYGTRELYSVESTKSWFEDFGSSRLMDGIGAVEIDPIFAEMVNLQKTYHVFLTPLGDCPLYVAEKTPTAFTVRAIGGETCNITFDYRIVAQRLGYEDVRMESVDLTEPQGDYDD